MRKNQQGASYIGILVAIIGFAFLAKIVIAVWAPYWDDRVIDGQIAELLQNAGIIRSRGKIEAAISNAKIVLTLRQEFGSFCNYLWGFSGGKVVLSPLDQPRATSPLSDRISADMKKRGMRYAGSVTIHSFLQAAGIVNEHELSCDRYQELMRETGLEQTIRE